VSPTTARKVLCPVVTPKFFLCLLFFVLATLSLQSVLGLAPVITHLVLSNFASSYKGVTFTLSVCRIDKGLSVFHILGEPSHMHAWSVTELVVSFSSCPSIPGFTVREPCLAFWPHPPFWISDRQVSDLSSLFSEPPERAVSLSVKLGQRK